MLNFIESTLRYFLLLLIVFNFCDSEQKIFRQLIQEFNIISDIFQLEQAHYAQHIWTNVRNSFSKTCNVRNISYTGVKHQKHNKNVPTALRLL